MQRRRQVEVELGGIDADERVRAQGEELGAQAAAQPPQPRQVMQHLEQPDDRELGRCRERLTARGLHRRPRDAHEARPRLVLADRPDQRGAQVVAGGLAGHHAEGRGAGRRHQRMMLRSLAPRNSTNGRISGWVAASSVSRSCASASFSPER